METNHRALYLVKGISDAHLRYILGQTSKSLEVTTQPGSFPGVYTTLVSTHNIHNIQNEYFQSSDWILFLGVNLLEQRNWHYNKEDMWGAISEGNTVFPWEFQHSLQQTSFWVSDGVGNEVVFHDNVPWEMVVDIQPCRDITWPTTAVVSPATPNLQLLGWYCYLDLNVTNPETWFLRALAALVVGKTTALEMSRQECISLIEQHGKQLQTHRHEQRFDDMIALLSNKLLY